MVFRRSLQLVFTMSLVGSMLLAIPTAATAATSFEVVNLGLAGETDTFLPTAFDVDEADQGADLNGDGDMVDRVVHFNSAGKVVRNSGLAGGSLSSHGQDVFLSVGEAGQGGTDLNGDGDATDFVLHLILPGSPPINLGVAGFASDGGYVSVDEAAQGADLNGDGDKLDQVAHAYDSNNHTLINLGLAGDEPTESGNGFLFAVVEADQGLGIDLNGDGDALDEVMHRWAPGIGVVNLGIAGDGGAPNQFDVDEAAQGADLNGDGDMADDVVHFYREATGTLFNTGLARGCCGALIEGDGALFLVAEARQGGTDLNGDGDATDEVVHAYTPGGGLVNTGFAHGAGGFGGEGGFFHSSEADQGADLNGDGDMVDEVFLSYDFAAETVTNTGLAVSGVGSESAPGGFLFQVSESGQAAPVDLNGDGDTVDAVIHFWDPQSKTSSNLMLAGAVKGFASGTFVVSEASQGATDLNGDGDTLDQVLHFFDGAAAASTGRAIHFSSRATAAGAGFLFDVDEAAQGGVDLNGDGDALDTVVHSFVHFVEHDVGLVDTATGVWYLRPHGGGAVTSFFYGDPSDAPFMGDWDCDGIATPGLYRVTDGFAYLRNSNTQGIADIRFFFGNPGDVPVVGDFNGDGCDTLSIYRPSEQRFYVINRLGKNEGGLGDADFDFAFGNPGDQPFVGDLDGDGVDEVGLHRATTGFVYYRTTLTTGIADKEYFYGDPGDRFVAGDWGILDGEETPAIFRPALASYFFRFTNSQGVADASFPFGAAPWLPVAGRLGLS